MQRTILPFLFSSVFRASSPIEYVIKQSKASPLPPSVGSAQALHVYVSGHQFVNIFCSFGPACSFVKSFSSSNCQNKTANIYTNKSSSGRRPPSSLLLLPSFHTHPADTHHHPPPPKKRANRPNLPSKLGQQQQQRLRHQHINNLPISILAPGRMVRPRIFHPAPRPRRDSRLPPPMARGDQGFHGGYCGD